MPMSSLTVPINGYALRIIRGLKGRGMADLARKLEVDRSYINKIELGYVVQVSSPLYARLLEELGITDYRTLMADPHGKRSVTA